MLSQSIFLTLAAMAKLQTELGSHAPFVERPDSEHSTQHLKVENGGEFTTRKRHTTGHATRRHIGARLTQRPLEYRLCTVAVDL